MFRVELFSFPRAKIHKNFYMQYFFRKNFKKIKSIIKIFY